jgi:hypothetical protein
MFVACVIRACLVDDDVLVRRNRQPDVDLKPDAVAMLVAGCDHLDAAAGNPVIMVSSRSISPKIWDRAASDDSVPSKVISGAICMVTFPAV